MKISHLICTNKIALAFLCLAMTASSAFAQTAPGTQPLVAAKSSAQTNAAVFSPEQTQAIQEMIHHYLLDHPEVLMEAANAYQKKQQAQWQNTAATVVPGIAAPLFGSEHNLVAGNPNGDVTLVEFFDYQCPHCKDMAPQLDDIIHHDPHLKVIFKPLPFFGDASVFAAKAVMAAQKQGKALAFHQALMKAPSMLNKDLVLQIAATVGINITQLQAEMKNPLFDNEIKENNSMAEKLKLTGTPAFVIAKVSLDNNTHKIASLKNTLLIPGAVGENLLIEAIGDVRGAKQ